MQLSKANFITIPESLDFHSESFSFRYQHCDMPACGTRLSNQKCANIIARRKCSAVANASLSRTPTDMHHNQAASFLPEQPVKISSGQSGQWASDLVQPVPVLARRNRNGPARPKTNRHQAVRHEQPVPSGETE
ncbi:hypothetical protein [Burkholderia cepacia]|uniref:hypothetical protein n=1 Tax=Burkholderia cepacia TaxID=292 RepID=UPI0016511B83|nr:hypothetical protein [Burkholderia cepacia]